MCCLGWDFCFTDVNLMFEMADSGGDHCNIVSVAVIYCLLVADRTAGLYHCRDSGLMCNLHAIGEGEECIGSHDGTIEVESE